MGVWELLVAALNENPVVCNVEPDVDTVNPPPNASPDVEEGADIAYMIILAKSKSNILIHMT